MVEQRAIPQAGRPVRVGIDIDGCQRRSVATRHLCGDDQPRQEYSSKKSPRPADHTPRFLLTVDAPMTRRSQQDERNAHARAEALPRPVSQPNM